MGYICDALHAGHLKKVTSTNGILFVPLNWIGGQELRKFNQVMIILFVPLKFQDRDFQDESALKNFKGITDLLLHKLPAPEKEDPIICLRLNLYGHSNGKMSYCLHDSLN